MNKKKISIIVGIISIILVIIGIIITIRFNENKKFSIASNSPSENVNDYVENNDTNLENMTDNDYQQDSNSNIEEYNSTNNTSEAKEETDYERYLRESDKDTFEEMKEFFEGTNDKIALYVNGEPITEKEISLKNFSLNNSYIKNYTNLNLTEEESDPVKAIIQDVAICQEAKKLGYSVTEEDINKMKSVPNHKEDMKKMAESANMSADEFEEVYIKSEIRTHLLSDWTMTAIDQIHNGEVKIDNAEFNEKYKEYSKIIENAKVDSENMDIKRAMELSTSMLKLYEQYIASQANVEYVN